MNRPPPLKSAASSTRSIERPTHGGIAEASWSTIDADRNAAGAIPTFLLVALFDATPISCQKSGGHRPYRLLSPVIKSSHLQLRVGRSQAASRATLRNSRGLTPAWSRKKRVKCAGSGNPKRSLSSLNGVSWWITASSTRSMRITFK